MCCHSCCEQESSVFGCKICERLFVLSFSQAGCGPSGRSTFFCFAKEVKQRKRPRCHWSSASIVRVKNGKTLKLAYAQTRTFLIHFSASHNWHNQSGKVKSKTKKQSKETKKQKQQSKSKSKESKAKAKAKAKHLPPLGILMSVELVCFSPLPCSDANCVGQNGKKSDV